jgi:meso-butanediol dehydrogenase/(S,S)-butanediol dehydrogenase/diacetyl reductase
LNGKAMQEIPMQRFQGTRVLVTAAASGIGAATARRFVQEGAHVLLSDIDAERLDALVQALRQQGGTVHGQVADAGDGAAVAALVAQAVQALGGLDVLVNNAGIGAYSSVTELSEESWQRVLDVSLSSVFHAAKAAMPHLRASRGCMVNTASISGLVGDYGFAAYAAAKGGVVNLTRTLALDHAREGVRVNAVCPGLVDTPLTRRFFEQPELMAAYERHIPMARPARPGEIAGAIAFLCSPDASYITGINLPVDGGLTAWTGQPRFSDFL